MKRLSVFFLGLIFFISCKPDESPKGLIDRNKMITVLTDVHLVNGYMTTIMDVDTMKQETANYLNLVYQKHNIDSVLFRKSLSYYSQHPKMLDEIYTEVIRNLDEQQKSKMNEAPRIVE